MPPKKSRLYGAHKGTSFRANVQAHGKRERFARPNGNHAGEPDGVLAQEIPARRGSGREQRQRISPRTHLRAGSDIDVPHTAGPIRELPSSNTGHPSRPGGRVRTPGGHLVHPRADAGAGGGSIQRHLRGTLQQGEPIADAGLPAPGCHRVAGAVAGELLPGGVHRRRAHQNPSQTERGHGSLLHDPGGEGGQDPEGAGHLQQAHRERLGLGADAGGPARAGRRQDRPHLRGRPQGAGGGHQRGLSGHEAPAVHHPPEAQHTERCPQRGQR